MKFHEALFEGMSLEGIQKKHQDDEPERNEPETLKGGHTINYHKNSPQVVAALVSTLLSAPSFINVF